VREGMRGMDGRWGGRVQQRVGGVLYIYE